jgi:hypothetical protein
MRRSGTTTRIIDRCVQELFTNGKTFVFEREDFSGKHTEAITDDTFERFKKRMKLEHSDVRYSFDVGTYSGIYCYKVQLNKQ